MKTVVLNRILPTAHVLVFHNKFSMALIADESLIYHGYSIYLITVNSKGQMSNNEFIRCVCQFVPPILSTNFSRFEQLKKKTDFLLVQNSFFLSLPVEKEITTNIR